MLICSGGFHLKVVGPIFWYHVFYPILIHTQKAIIFPNLSCIALLVLMLEAKAHFRFSYWTVHNFFCGYRTYATLSQISPQLLQIGCSNFSMMIRKICSFIWYKNLHMFENNPTQSEQLPLNSCAFYFPPQNDDKMQLVLRLLSKSTLCRCVVQSVSHCKQTFCWKS